MILMRTLRPRSGKSAHCAKLHGPLEIALLKGDSDIDAAHSCCNLTRCQRCRAQQRDLPPSAVVKCQPLRNQFIPADIMGYMRRALEFAQLV